MDDSIVYRKTRRGTTELAATHGGALSPQARRVLILLNGERTLAELADLFGSESVEHIVADLETQGFARQVDPDDDAGQTTQSIPTQVGDLRASLYEPPPERRGSGWIVLGLFLASAVIASGYWLIWRPSHVGQAVIAAARASDADRAAVSPASEEPGSPTPVDPQPVVRELPLSGLPAVTVTTASKAAVAGASAAAEAPEDTVAVVPASVAAIVPAGAELESPAPGRRSAERQAPAAPIPATKAAPLAEAASSPAPSPPTMRAVSATVASAVSARMEQTAADVPAAEGTLPAPTAGSERQTLAAAGAAPVAAATTSAPAAPATPSPPAGTPPASPPADQIAALAPPAGPQSAPVQLHPRKHDPPGFPGRALRSRILEGRVLARLYVTAEGKVEQVDIVKATPAKVFDDEVKRALSEWTFDPPGRPVDTTVELNFKQ